LGEAENWGNRYSMWDVPAVTAGGMQVIEPARAVELHTLSTESTTREEPAHLGARVLCQAVRHTPMNAIQPGTKAVVQLATSCCIKVA
jgi:hypothetical protein